MTKVRVGPIVFGGGGGLHQRRPPDIFTGATVNAAQTARNTYFSAVANAGALAEFQADSSLAIVLRVTGADDAWQTYAPGQNGLAYDAGQWLDRTDALQSTTPGPAGQGVPAGGAADEILFKSAAGDYATAWRALRDSDIPAGVARDAEVSAAVDALAADAAAKRAALAAAIAAIVPGAMWGIGAAEPTGGAAGMWYLRTGNDAPGIYYRNNVSWGLVLPLPDLSPFARLDGATFTGHASGIAPTQAAHFATKEYVDKMSSGPAPSDTQNHCGTSADTAVDATELAAATSGASNALAVPAYNGRRYVWFLRPAAAGAVSQVYLYERGHRNTSNQSSAFAAVDVTLGGTRYLGVISRDTLASAADTIMEVA